ncbi:MAG: hypothetical protein [Caudoviricetes sp.]|nr:MAG: hypothetical protein [Caudoviricetes sp.]
MNILGLKITRANASQASQQTPQSVYGATTMGLINTQMRTKRSDYGNSFGPVNALVQEAVERAIYPVGPTGAKLLPPYPKAWQILQAPNTSMDFKSFLRSALIGYLSNSSVEMLAWHDSDTHGSDPEPGYTDMAHWCGLTFLPKGSRNNVLNETQYQVLDAHGQRQIVTDADVISLHYSMDPGTLAYVSPVSASHEFAQILDSLAAQVRAYYNNGAVPELIVTIHAKTNEEFQKIRRAFERHNRGPSNSYGTVYQQVIDNGVQGNNAPKIDITPVGGNGLDMNVKEICDVASQKINANLGVSSLIYGDTDSVSYQNQEVVNDKFNKRVTNTLKQFLSSLTFELNRMTGGIGFAFGFEYEETEFAEKELTQAQTIYAKAQAFELLINSGVDSDKAAAAVDAPDTWIGMAASRQQVTPQSISMAPVNVYTDRQQPLSTSVDKTVDKPVETAKPEPEQNASGDRVAERQPEKHDKIHDLLREMAIAHFKRALTPGRANAVQDQDRKYILQLEALLQEIADNGGVTAARQLAQMIHSQTISTGYEIAGTPLHDLADRAATVIDNYSRYLDSNIEDLQQPIRTPDGQEQTLSDDKILAILLASVETGPIASRIQEIVTSEGKHAFQTGQLDNVEQIQREVAPQGVVIQKIWKTTSGHPCEFCEAMDGTEVGVMDGFVVGGIITDDSGRSLVLDEDYSDGSTPDAHANCQCVFTWQVDESDAVDGEDDNE